MYRARNKKRDRYSYRFPDLLTDTQGLDVALGVGDRCTVTNAIQDPTNQDLGDIDMIIREGEKHPSSGSGSGCLVCSLAAPSSIQVVGACAEAAGCQTPKNH